MSTPHFIIGHAILIPTVFAALAGLAYAIRHLDAPEHGRLGDPLDAETVRRWNAQAH